MKKRSGWERALQVEASGRGMVGHAGAVLLHRTADRIGLVGRLRGVLRASPWLLDRADVLVSLIVGIGLGAVNLAQAELLARHHAAVLGGQASDSTLWRTLEEIDARTREKIGRARAAVRARVWTLLQAREAGFPWITILGKQLAGWIGRSAGNHHPIAVVELGHAGESLAEIGEHGKRELRAPALEAGIAAHAQQLTRRDRLLAQGIVVDQPVGRDIDPVLAGDVAEALDAGGRCGGHGGTVS